MSKEKISASIELLRAEIANLKVEDTTAKARLDRLVAELESGLTEPEPASAATLNESVKELIEQFEVEHPRITGVLNDMMVTLSGMGI
jgi:hypothetical protein